jgi:putative endonuclease
MQFHAYILYSPSLDRFYVGHTGVLPEERLRKHLSNHRGFTSRAKDWTIFHTEPFPSKSAAYAREMEIKRKKSRKYIESLHKDRSG